MFVLIMFLFKFFVFEDFFEINIFIIKIIEAFEINTKKNYVLHFINKNIFLLFFENLNLLSFFIKIKHLFYKKI